MLTVHLVSHTHWDREWYHPAGRFRQRLVALVDELLDDPPRDGASFLLDGQTVVLDDYLAVRPERAAELAALLRSRALEAGPWFVLSDELIPNGETLVRNLLQGRRTLRALRAEAPPVLYCPDSFGHPAALPSLARGFGLDMVVVWRGFGSRRWPDGDACWWAAPSGERALLYHLPRSGYEFGADLPVDAAAATTRWRNIRDELKPRARIGVVLLLNGADHHARQRDLSAAITALAGVAAPTTVSPSSLGAFAGAARDAAGAARLPEIHGELRDSYGYAWTLQGTLATRAHQKRRAARIARLLVREVEPWTALAARQRSGAGRALVLAAWRELLLGHPHDTLCGCSTDAVARAFDAHLDEAGAQAEGLRDDAIAALAGHDPEHARGAHEAWRPQLVLRNPAARARGGVAVVDIAQFVAHVPVGPGSAPGETPHARRSTPGVPGVAALQVLERAVRHERMESPRAYPDDDLVAVSRAAVWVSELAGYGMRAHAVGGRRAAAAAIPDPVRVNGRTMDNGRLIVAVRDGGVVEVQDVVTGRMISDVLTVEDQDDAGDLYTASPRGALRGAQFVGARAMHRGPLRGTIEIRWRVVVRAGARVTLRVRLSLDADSDILRVGVDGENGAADHRLRLRLNTGADGASVFADAAFGPVERVPLRLSAEEQMVEAAPPTAPLHRYVSLFNAAGGATVFSDGLAEYEADDAGAVRVTLVRAVGELSRADLPERPGHAGWPAPTPEAQCLGPFGAELALLLHGPRDAAVIARIERAAEDVLTPITGHTMRALLAAPPELAGLSLDGEGLAFSCAKESEDGVWLVLRCVNLLDRVVRGRWVVGFAIAEARVSRLDETPGDAVPARGGGVEFAAPPRGVVTLLVR